MSVKGREAVRVREGEDVCEPVIVLMLAEGSSDGWSMKKFFGLV